MTTEENDKQKRTNDPKPVKPLQPSKERQEIDRDIKKSHDPDWSNKPSLHEGYRPTEDTTNPEPPSESGTAEEQ